MARKSRLSKNFQKKSRNTFILSVLGIIIILYLLFTYGLPLLSDASFLFGKVTSTPSDIDNEAEEEIYVPTPRLYSLPNATKDETVIVKGSSLAGLIIEIYLNGNKAGEVEADESGEFEYEINLTEGENIIKAKAIIDGSESGFSNSKSIALNISGPDLKIDSPANDSEIKGGNPIEIKGTTDPDSTVSVNGFQAIINSEGTWTYRISLVDGGNDITVISTDLAGNETEETIRVNYSQ